MEIARWGAWVAPFSVLALWHELVWYAIKCLQGGLGEIIGLYVERISEGMGKDSIREGDTRPGVMPIADFLTLTRSLDHHSVLGPLPPSHGAGTRSSWRTTTQTQFGPHPAQPAKYTILGE